MASNTVRMPAGKVKNNFGLVSNKVGYGNERIIVTKNNRELMVMMSIEDYLYFRELEDMYDAELVKTVRKNIAKEGTKPLDEFIEELNLEENL